MAMYRDDGGDFAGDFHVDDNRVLFSNQQHDAQDGMETISNGTTDDSSNQGEAYDFEFGPSLRDKDRLLPLARVASVMKKALPVGVMQSKEAQECVQECVSEFISFITSEASDICSRENRKIIKGDDIICAMGILGFDNYVEPMTLYLQKYREAKRREQFIKTEDLPDDTFSNDTNPLSVFKQECSSDSEMYYEESNKNFINNL